VRAKGDLSKECKVTINSFLAATNRSAAFRALFHTIGHWQNCVQQSEILAEFFVVLAYAALVIPLMYIIIEPTDHIPESLS